MGKSARVYPAIFLMIILLVTAGETTEAKPWWEKIGDAVGNAVDKATGGFQPVEMGLSLKGGPCVRKILSVSTNMFHDDDWCIARNDTRAPMYMNIEKLPNDWSIDSILKKPVDFLKNNYPELWKALRFNQSRKKKRPRRTL